MRLRTLLTEEHDAANAIITFCRSRRHQALHCVRCSTDVLVPESKDEHGAGSGLAGW